MVKMSWDIITKFIADVVPTAGFIIAIASYLKTQADIRDMKSKEKLTDATAAQTITNAANDAVALIQTANESDRKRLSERYAELEAKYFQLEEKVKETDRRYVDLYDKYVKLEHENDVLRDWAERLVAQVVSQGGEPVPMIPRRKSRND